MTRFRSARWPILSLVLLFALQVVARGQTTEFNGVTVPGTVLAHTPKSTGIYFASPSLVIAPNGDYIASHDVTGPDSPTPKQTRIYRSQDRGQSWTPLTTLSGQFWSNLFVHDDALYVMGTTEGNGSVVIRKSTDGGASWTTPAGATSGLLAASSPTLGYHTAPVPMVVANGRIWRGIEARNPTQSDNAIRAGVMSAPVGADLLKASSWTFSNRILRDTDWLPADGFTAWREGNVVVDPAGNLLNVIRVDVPRGATEKAAIQRIVDADTVAFDPDADIIDFNGGAKKFTIRYSPVTGSYWTIVNLITDENRDPAVFPSSHRNIVALAESKDLRSWDTRRILLKDLSDMANIGFQYWDWQFDGHDIVALSRTAFPDGLGGAERFHDANFITFHRFAEVIPEPATAAAGSVILGLAVLRRPR